jgi:hypothetical protein
MWMKPCQYSRVPSDNPNFPSTLWTVYPNSGPNPVNPFKAAHVTSNGVTTYDLPFTPKNLSSAKQPVMVLGENGTVFASGTSVSTDDPDKDVSQIVAFDVGSGAVNWTYKTTDGGLLSIVAATQEGVAVSSSVSGIIHFDSSGTAAQITGNLGAIAQYSWNGDWHFENDQGVHGLNMPLVVDDASTWATPEGNASKNGGAGALCGCSAQSSESEGALGTQAYSTRVYHAIGGWPTLSPVECIASWNAAEMN